MTEFDIQAYKEKIRSSLQRDLIITMTTATEFAKKIGVHHHTVLQFLKGSQITRLPVVNKIEEFLKSQSKQ